MRNPKGTGNEHRKTSGDPRVGGVQEKTGSNEFAGVGRRVNRPVTCQSRVSIAGF